MSIDQHQHPGTGAPAAQPRVIKVGPDVIAAAQLRETLDKILKRPTSRTIAKIARAGRA